MFRNSQLNLVASSEDVHYCIITGDPQSQRPYGILATVKDTPDDSEPAENLFFTEAEATACCKWLAENNVFPITLCEVLSDLYTL